MSHYTIPGLIAEKQVVSLRTHLVKVTYRQKMFLGLSGQGQIGPAFPNSGAESQTRNEMMAKQKKA